MKALLLPLGIVFRWSSQLRSFLYRKSILKSYRLKSPVISVGNLTVGGTGKTPFVDVLLSQMEAHGAKTCVLTRGYGRQSRATMTVSASSTVSDVGDEPRWLFGRHPGTTILVSKNRAFEAQKILGTDVFILDDGLQHLKLKRDFEITLLDATRPLSDYRLLPVGRARNSLDTLKRAHLVVLTRANQVPPPQLQLISEKIGTFAKCPVIECGVRFVECRDLRTGKTSSLEGKKVLLVSGIGNPESFEKLLRDDVPDLNIVIHHGLKDHFLYTEGRIQKFMDEAKQKNCDFILVTEKDAVKWAEIMKNPVTSVGEIPVGVVMTKLTFKPELPDIYDLVFDKSR